MGVVGGILANSDRKGASSNVLFLHGVNQVKQGLGRYLRRDGRRPLEVATPALLKISRGVKPDMEFLQFTSAGVTCSQRLHPREVYVLLRFAMNSNRD